MKYIDADKLIAEIERLKDGIGIGLCEYDAGEEDGKMEILIELSSFITSLQQEQPIRKPHNGSWIEETKKELQHEEELLDMRLETLKRIRDKKNQFQQEQLETPSGEEVMTMCNQILIDWVKEGKTPEEREQREQAHIRFFELYDEYMEQPEVDLEKEIHRYFNPHGMALQFDRSKGNTILKPEQLFNFARHFYALGLNARKEESK